MKDDIDQGQYAGIRKDGKELITDNGSFQALRKNHSKAFEHLDMSKTAYNQYLQSTEQEKQ